jgi:hypothetical protein
MNTKTVKQIWFDYWFRIILIFVISIILPMAGYIVHRLDIDNDACAYTAMKALNTANKVEKDTAVLNAILPRVEKKVDGLEEKVDTQFESMNNKIDSIATAINRLNRRGGDTNGGE